MEEKKEVSKSLKKEDEKNKIITYEEVIVEIEEEKKTLSSSSKESEEKKLCSYKQGYIEQEVFSCKTCYYKKMSSNSKYKHATINPNNISQYVQPAGFCSACLETCHKGHNVYELDLKRNFKCDCGNSKYECKCQLCPQKDEENVRNQYNKNYFGRYCYCNLKYEGDYPMVECLICQDWFHFHHLHPPRDPVVGNEGDFICKPCLKKHSFLLYYKKKFFSEEKVEESSDHKEGILETKEQSFEKEELLLVKKQEEEIENTVPVKESMEKPNLHHSGQKRKIMNCADFDEELFKIYKKKGSKEKRSENMNCRLRELKQTLEAPCLNEIEDSFFGSWPHSLGEILCKCSNCNDFYSSHNISFLLHQHKEDQQEDHQEDKQENKQENKQEAPQEDENEAQSKIKDPLLLENSSHKPTEQSEKLLRKNDSDITEKAEEEEKALSSEDNDELENAVFSLNDLGMMELQNLPIEQQYHLIETYTLKQQQICFANAKLKVQAYTTEE